MNIGANDNYRIENSKNVTNHMHGCHSRKNVNQEFGHKIMDSLDYSVYNACAIQEFPLLVIKIIILQ